MLPAEILPDGTVRVDMGPALAGWRDVPLAWEADTLHLDLAAGAVRDPAACSMGNPHATFFVADLAAVPVTEIGPELEHARDLSRARQYRLRPGARSRPHPPAGLGARRRD